MKFPTLEVMDEAPAVYELSEPSAWESLMAEKVLLELIVTEECEMSRSVAREFVARLKLGVELRISLPDEAKGAT